MHKHPKTVNKIDESKGKGEKKIKTKESARRALEGKARIKGNKGQQRTAKEGKGEQRRAKEGKGGQRRAKEGKRE